ncbi:MerR family transcriptional regulator [Demequina muriae]|uniref:MerR family transcriptional regulator n=1 Tax=Demequina muriae TaxID=3051664 RepID=A0ABT8GGQ8_9MICO|nr:MerR family transcriptional regulator [Demequina sp. EGI L300058]MDN4480610.1 MerR family transcriptional regulator [Demequina sp. EGI L300058]
MSGYSIDQAAAQTGTSKHTLRYYEREGLLAPVAKAPNGHRRYTDDDLGWVRFLQLLRATGMPIREMKEFVALTHAGDHTIADRVAVLAHYREALVARMEADRDHLDRLEMKLDYYRGVLQAADAEPEDITRRERASGQPARS